MVDQVTRKTFHWSIKAPSKFDNFDQQISLDADGDDTYRLTPYLIKVRNPVKIFTPDEIENRFTNADFIAQQLGIYSQHDWTKSIEKTKFNQLVDDAAIKFVVARAINFADLAKQAQLQAQFSQSRTDHNDYLNKIFISGKEFTLRRLDWRDFINGNYLKESLIGVFGYPWYVLKETAIIWTVLNLLHCLFGLFRSALNTYNLKSLLGPKITLAKIITSGFFGVFLQTIFHVLQTDSTQYKPPSPKKLRKYSIDSCTPRSQHELNLLHKKFESFYEKFSSPVHNYSNKIHISSLPVSVYQCYEKPINPRMKPDFRSLHLNTFQPNKLKRSLEIFFSTTLLKKTLIMRKYRKTFFLIFQALEFNTLFVLVNSTAVPTHLEGGSPIPQNVDPRHTILSCWRSMTSYHHPSRHWCWKLQYPNSFVKCKRPPS